MSSRLALLVRDAAACELCATELPLGPRPVFQAHGAAKILIAGQGTKDQGACVGTSVHRRQRGSITRVDGYRQ